MYSKFAFFILALDFMLIDSIGWVIDWMYDFEFEDSEIREVVILNIVAFVALLLGLMVWLSN